MITRYGNDARICRPLHSIENTNRDLSLKILRLHPATTCLVKQKLFYTTDNKCAYPKQLVYMELKFVSNIYLLSC